MGLDWLLMRRKPKPGKVKPFAALEKKLTALREAGASREELRALEGELDALSIRAEEAIGAPRVGVDERATLWWREHVYAPNFERVTLGIGNPEYLAYWERPRYAAELRDATEAVVESGELSQSSSEYVTVMAAVAWLEFWSSRGFGFIAWS